MRLILFSVLLIILSCSPKGSSDEYSELSIFKAEQIYRSNQDLQTACRIYVKAFQKRVTDGSKVLDAINCATKIKDTTATRLFMEKGMEIGLEISDYERLWKYFGNGADIKEAISRCDTLKHQSIYKEHLNDSLIAVLEIMAVRDQQYRDGEKEDMKLQKENDRLNWSELKKLTLELRRLPKYSEIGFDGSDNLDLLFHHMDKEEIEWFLPYVVKNIQEAESNLAEVLLYQIDRIGMDEQVIYTITEELKIKPLGKRTKMSNGLLCQSYGEWFKEKSMEDDQLYHVPIDPIISVHDVNRIRTLFRLDSIHSKWKRENYARHVSIEEFELKIKG